MTSDRRDPEGAHLSTTLPALILSMTMTGLLRWLADVSVMPSVAPGDLTISTSSGPDTFVSVSERAGAGSEGRLARCSALWVN